MDILVRMPNWLGDMVMSTGFVHALQKEYPDSRIDVIVKKGLETLTEFIPGINHHYVFDREEFKGLKGAYLFGRKIREKKKYDLFFCLPDSFSSAAMGWGTGAKQRIGFKKELRSILLTKSYTRPTGMHRAEEYVFLLQQFTGENISDINVSLHRPVSFIPQRIIINFNSEAISRRMPVHKAVKILARLIQDCPDFEFVCIGSKKEKAHIDAILLQAGNPATVKNMAGETRGLNELINLVGTGSAMLTTDSGPAHVANALGVPAVILFGAGNEKNTAPYNKTHRSILRLGQLPCEPCVKNTCIYGLPKCLELLDEQRITASLLKR
jgi:lipopolysaccharide heptosyltransferase II